ncbi:unnamed protein product, partial [Staurois parvus]
MPPFTSAAVNHWVPDGDYPLVPGDYRGSPMGRRAALFTNSSPPCQLGHTALDSYQCAYSEAPTHRPPVKHSLHTVNPLIIPHINPFLPSVIRTVSVLFFFSTDHCIGVPGDVSDTKSVPPSVRRP